MAPRETQTLDPQQVEKWCREAVAGDTSALEKLLWIYHGRLAAFVDRKIGVTWRGKIDVDDVLQDTYVDIYNGISNFTYEHEDSFYRWATWLLNRHFINHVRRLRRQKRDVGRTKSAGTSSGHQTFLERHFAQSATPSRVARRGEAVSALMSCIANLPEDYRVVIRRVHLNEEPLAVVAADMGRSEDAVRRLGSRAVERLAQCMQRASRYLTHIP